jgi:hypothetical protein
MSYRMGYENDLKPPNFVAVGCRVGIYIHTYIKLGKFKLFISVILVSGLKDAKDSSS